MRIAAILFRKLLITAMFFGVATIAFLEIGSRYYRCPETGRSYAGSSVCDPRHHPVDQNRIQAILTVIKSGKPGLEPSRADLDRIITLTKYEEMPGLNGILCPSGMIFVRDNLSSEAKYFVARHELQHVYSEHGMNTQCGKEEYCATMSAARVYPLGFVETILSSLSVSFNESRTVWCFLFGSWNIFKIYLLAW
jgi:hypothetical protein